MAKAPQAIGKWPHYDGSYNFGHLIQAVLLVGAIVSIYVTQQKFNTKTELQIAAIGDTLKEFRDVNKELIAAVNTQSNRITALETKLGTMKVQ